MKRNIIVLSLLLATTFFWLPVDNSVAAQGRGNGRWQQSKNRHGKWKKNSHGYKNYGQYRRTQVGNRRYRMAKRTFWSNGHRVSRYIRVYY